MPSRKFNFLLAAFCFVNVSAIYLSDASGGRTSCHGCEKDLMSKRRLKLHQTLQIRLLRIWRRFACEQNWGMWSRWGH